VPQTLCQQATSHTASNTVKSNSNLQHKNTIWDKK